MGGMKGLPGKRRAMGVALRLAVLNRVLHAGLGFIMCSASAASC